MKQYSKSCEQNKASILEILKVVYKDSSSVLEIGSGTGQHAIYFAKHLPHLIWQPSDLAVNLASIRAWIEEADLNNLKWPIEFDVQNPPSNLEDYDAVFTANSLHIMSWPMVEDYFEVAAKLLGLGDKMLIYGPFSYRGKHTSPSNVQFDRYLKQQNPRSGVRDFIDIERLARGNGLQFLEDYDMPANNRCLAWVKNGAGQSS